MFATARLSNLKKNFLGDRSALGGQKDLASARIGGVIGNGDKP